MINLDYYPKTKEEKLKLFNFKNLHISEANKIYQNQDYKEINLEEYYKIVYCRNNNNPLGKNNCLNQDFLNNLNNLELPFEKEIGESQLLEKYIYNSIIIELTGEGQSNKNWVVTKDLHILEEVKGKDFVISAPVTYVGRNRNANNARNLYALAIDLDYVGENQIKNLLLQIDRKLLPNPNLITNSGTGLHLYYLLEKPIPLYKNMQILLDRLKHGITNSVWNQFTSGAERQYQNVIQGYRLPCTKTKLGNLAKCWVNKNSEYYSVKKLNDWIEEYDFDNKDIKLTEYEIDILESSIDSKHKPSKKLEEAKEKWPEWYQERIIEGKPRKYIVYKKDLYNWWFKTINTKNNITLGHRYYCALALVSFATKCNVPYDEVKKDLYSLRELFDSITIEEENHFTKGDIEDALKIYGSDKAHKFKREFVSKQCRIVISKNKRNGRTREEHLKFARASKAFKKMFQEPYDLPDNREQKFKTNTIDLLVSTLYKNKTEKITVEKLYKLTGISTSTINRYKNKIFERYSKNYPNEINPLNSKEQNKNALIELLKINGISILSNKDNLAKELLISKRTLERILKDETVQKIIENQKKIEEVFS